MNFTLAFVIILIIIYVYQIQFSKKNFEQAWLDDVLPQLKTGDLICFKAYNHFNAVVFGTYFTHIGIVYVDNGVPYIFEAANVTPKLNLLDHHNQNGVFYSKVDARIRKYKGRCFIKTLENPIEPSVEKEFKTLINYAMTNMYYKHDVFTDSIRKMFGRSVCTHSTNCAELVLISLIKLELLPKEWLDKTPLFHHLYWMINIQQLINNRYLDIYEVRDHPFDE